MCRAPQSPSAQYYALLCSVSWLIAHVTACRKIGYNMAHVNVGKRSIYFFKTIKEPCGLKRLGCVRQQQLKLRLQTGKAQHLEADEGVSAKIFLVGPRVVPYFPAHAHTHTHTHIQCMNCYKWYVIITSLVVSWRYCLDTRYMPFILYVNIFTLTYFPVMLKLV